MLTTLAVALAGFGCSAVAPAPLPYRNPKLSIEKRVDDLLGRLTPAEQRELSTGAEIRSLGVPAMTAIHFPNARAIAATWDVDLMAKEAQAFASKALHDGHRLVIGPTLNQFGEDPWLASRMAVAMVSGLQGEGVIATLPDYLAEYGKADERTRNEMFLPPYRAAVEEAGIWALETTPDEPGQWGFKGFAAGPQEDLRPRLRAMVASGFFDPAAPATPEAPAPRLADESIVLLKNEGGLLPLSPILGSIAVIGGPLPEMPPQAVYASGNSIPEAADLARRSLAAVVFSDNAELVRAVAKENRNTAEVSDGASVAGLAPAVMIAWGSHDIARVLFGEVSPSGRLPFSIAKQSPKGAGGIYTGYRYYDRSNTEPLFPFGAGLSYTAFEYSGLQVFPKTARYGQLIQVSIKIRNAGSRDGAEVVQLYVRPLQAVPDRPLKELKGFRRVELKPGESQTVSFELDGRALSFYDPVVHEWATEPGRFEVILGSSSRDIRARESFELFR